MSPRLRAGLFFVLAGLAAATGAVMVGSYREGALEGYGELRPVLVTAKPLPSSGSIDARAINRRVEVRNVPERFLPSDSLSAPSEALGLEPVATLPAGTYLTRSNLLPPRARRSRPDPRLVGNRSPVEIRVDGVAALSAGGPSRPRRVDVVVTTDPRGAGPGRTFVAAADVPLLAIRQSLDQPDAGQATAILGLHRDRALALIAAESFARSVRLLPVPSQVP